MPLLNDLGVAGDLQEEPPFCLKGTESDMKRTDRWQWVGPTGQRGRHLCLGEGTEMVLLASPLARGECYIPTAEQLARYGRTHLFEMPGSGRSDPVASPWSLEDYASWTARMI